MTLKFVTVITMVTDIILVTTLIILACVLYKPSSYA